LAALAIHCSALALAQLPLRAGLPLTTDQQATVLAAATLLREKKLIRVAGMVASLTSSGRMSAATSDDQYIAAAQRSGDTPFAYTLPDDLNPHHPIAIVLASRFFDQTTPTARASILTHEIGHWSAYLKHGKSDEYDGYKAQFDTHRQLGLTERDGLTYFMMLDGVVEYVVPRDCRYANMPEVKAYMSETP
jgi:hypothetical protein